MIEMLLGAWKETDVDFNAVFKKGFVTNEVDRSEDFLVSDNFFSLIVDDVLEYRTQLLNSDVPANLQTIAKRLIPPKGIRSKNIEGSKQLDYMEGEPIIDDLEPAEQSDNDEQFSSDEESDQENVDQDQDKLSAKLSIISSVSEYLQ